MAARRESEQRVELFPFLAVLVCAMGALILLLLVMTRRIRQQAELRAEYDRQVALAAVAEPPRAPPLLAIAPPPVKPAPQPAPRWTPPAVTRRPVVVPEPPPIYVDPTYDQRLAVQKREHREATAALERDWRDRIAQLTTERERLDAELQQLSQSVQAGREKLQNVEQQAAAMANQTGWDATVEQRLQTDLADLERRSAAVRQEIATVGRQLQAAQSQRATAAAQQFTIVPIEAHTGTTRRPIVLECDRDQISFVSEGITLTAADLTGFIPHYNPLSAGVQTLVDGWSVSDKGKPPYVLLVVRPEGTVAFYAARMFLQPLNIPFGYELVGQEQKFVWPQTEPRLVRECRRSIDEVLRDRGRVGQLSQASGRFEEPLRVLGQDGGFRLDEVDRMRQPVRTVQFGGTQIDREQFTNGGASGENAPDRRGLNLFRRPAAGGGEPVSGRPTPAAGATPSSEVASAEARDAADSGAPQPSGGWTQSPGFGRGREVRDPYSWRPPRGNGVAIQREVPIEISAKRVRVTGEEPQSLAAQADIAVLAKHVAQGLENQIAAWGEPPRGYYWSPRLKLIVTPDGAVLSGQLTPIIEAWGLESTLDYASKFSRGIE